MRAPVELRTPGTSVRTLLLGVIAVAAIVAAVAVVLRTGPSPAPATADSLAAPLSAPSTAGYVKFDGVDGESKDANHDKWIDILSVSQSITRPMSGGISGSTRQRGSATLGDVVVVKEVDKSTPKLQESIAAGRVFPEVVLDVTSPSTAGAREPYLQWELKNVQVTNYRISGSTGDGAVPTETFSLNFEEIKVTYTENDATGKPAGKVDYSWKVEEGVN